MYIYIYAGKYVHTDNESSRRWGNWNIEGRRGQMHHNSLIFATEFSFKHSERIDT